jgi:hypothetical protein
LEASIELLNLNVAVIWKLSKHVGMHGKKLITRQGILADFSKKKKINDITVEPLIYSAPWRLELVLGLLMTCL